jgi:hypothetical protein
MNRNANNEKTGPGAKRPILSLTVAVRMDGALPLPGEGSLPASRLLWTSAEGKPGQARTVQVLLLPN